MAVTGPYDHSIKYIGLSTDTKPTVGILPGTKFYETDTGKIFIYSGSAWVQEQEDSEMTIRGPYEYPKYYIGLSTDTKPPAMIGDEFFETNTRLTYICYDGTNWAQKITVASGSMTTVTDPAINAAVTTVIIDAYTGTIITLTGAGNAQTLQDPTVVTAGKIFTVVNDDTSTNSIVVNGFTITPGEGQSFIWDGSAWGPIDIGITSLPVPIAQGGTGQTTAAAALVALTPYTTTVTAAGTTVLTVTSTYRQFFTGSTTQTVTMPVTSTLTLGQAWRIVNKSTGVVTVNSSGGNAIVAMVANSECTLTCILITGTTATSWDVEYSGISSVTGTGAMVLATSPTLVTPALGTPASGVLTNCDLSVPPAIGGTTPNTGAFTDLIYLDVIITDGATGNVTAAQMKGQTHKVTGAYVMSLPTAVAGYNATFFASTAAAFSVDVLTATDIIILNGTPLAAGNKITSDGTLGAKVYIECTEAGYYRATSILGVFIDGGAG